jgi:hypothetical protein
MYGAVPLRTIKQTLLAHKAAGTLSKVKMLLYAPSPSSSNIHFFLSLFLCFCSLFP